MDFDRIVAVLRAFEREGVAYKIIGGVAMNLQGLARGTRDLGVFVLPTADNVERLQRALHSVFDDASIDDITAEDLQGEYPAIQYVPPVEGFHLDILSRLGAEFSFADIEVEARAIAGMDVPVATRKMDALRDEEGHRETARSSRRGLASDAAPTGDLNSVALAERHARG